MTITTERLLLEPLTSAHAEEMAPLLDDVALHRYTGGALSAPDELRERYVRQAAGRSADGSEEWHNWVLRERATGAAVGYVQATVDSARASADLAWVVGTAYQGCGYAHEAALAMAAWLHGAGVKRMTAHIHPDHAASMAVARAVGLSPTDVFSEGEVRWVG